MNFFDKLNYAIRSGEQSAVNFFSAVGPWLAPLAPAYLSYYHMVDGMLFPHWIALSIAAVVEILGLSAVSTVISFWAYNRRRVANYKKAPIWWALASFIAYLFIILTMNVMMDASEIIQNGLYAPWVKVAAGGMLTLLSVPAAVILAVRTQHKEMLDSLDSEKVNQKPQAVTVRVKSSAAPKASHKKRMFLDQIKNGKLQEALGSVNAKSIAEFYGVSERTAWRWLADVKQQEA